LLAVGGEPRPRQRIGYKRHVQTLNELARHDVIILCAGDLLARKASAAPRDRWNASRCNGADTARGYRPILDFRPRFIRESP
jgi:hypothetical protein